MPSLLIPSLSALVPLVTGVALIARARRGRRPRPACGACGHDLGTPDGHATTCPACGSSLAEVGIVSERAAPRPGLTAAGVMLIVLGAGCFGGAIVAQRASERAALEAEAAAEDARRRWSEAIDERIAEGRAEALEHAVTRPDGEAAAPTADPAQDGAGDVGAGDVGAGDAGGR